MMLALPPYKEPTYLDLIGYDEESENSLKKVLAELGDILLELHCEPTKIILQEVI